MNPTSRSERIYRLPVLRLRVMRGQLTCLVRLRGPETHRDGTGVMAFVACPRAPFLRRLRLYRRPSPPGDAPRAA